MCRSKMEVNKNVLFFGTLVFTMISVSCDKRKIGHVGDNLTVITVDDEEDNSNDEEGLIIPANDWECSYNRELIGEELRLYKNVPKSKLEVKILYDETKSDDEAQEEIQGETTDEILEIIGSNGKVDVTVREKKGNRFILDVSVNTNIGEGDKIEDGLTIKTKLGKTLYIPIVIEKTEKTWISFIEGLNKCQKEDKEKFIQNYEIGGIKGNEVIRICNNNLSNISQETFINVCKMISNSEKITYVDGLNEFINKCQGIIDFKPLFAKYDYLKFHIKSETYNHIICKIKSEGCVNEIFESIDDACLEGSNLDGEYVLLEELKNFQLKINTKALTKILKLINKNDFIGTKEFPGKLLFDFAKSNYDNIENFNPLFEEFKGFIALKNLETLFDIIKKHSSDKIFQSIVPEKFVPSIKANDIFSLFDGLMIELSEDTFDKICTAIDPNSFKSKDIASFISKNTNYIKNLTKLFEVCSNNIIDVPVLKVLIERTNKEKSDQLLQTIDKSKYAIDLNPAEVLGLFKDIQFTISDNLLDKICLMLKRDEIKSEDVNDFVKNNATKIDDFTKFKKLFNICPPGIVNEELLKTLIAEENKE